MDLTQLKTHITTGLSDAALQDRLDAAQQAVIRALGPVGPVTEMFTRISGPLILLARRTVEVTGVIEGTTTLAANDYELREGTLLRRLSSGTNPSWRWRTYAGPVLVTSIPESDLAERDMVVVDLVKLDLVYSPTISSQRIGDWAESYDTSKPIEDARAEILGRLASDDDPIGF